MTFVITSECYMMMSYFLLKNGKKVMYDTRNEEVKSLKYKKILFIVNVISFSFAGYFFLRHNDRCETGSNANGNLWHPNFWLFLKFGLFFSYSLYAFRSNGIYCRSDKHGLPYDILLGLL